MADTYKTITNVPGWVETLTSDGVPNSVDVLYKRVPIFFRAVQLRCDALASVPVKIYKGEDKEVEWPYPTKLGELLWRWEASCCYSQPPSKSNGSGDKQLLTGQSATGSDPEGD